MEVNGVLTPYPGEITVADFLARQNLIMEHTVVEIHGEIIPRSKWHTRLITEGDKIEIVTFVGGG